MGFHDPLRSPLLKSVDYSVYIGCWAELHNVCRIFIEQCENQVLSVNLYFGPILYTII